MSGSATETTVTSRTFMKLAVHISSKMSACLTRRTFREGFSGGGKRPRT